MADFAGAGILISMWTRRPQATHINRGGMIMRKTLVGSTLLVCLLALNVLPRSAEASAPMCGQAQVETLLGAAAPPGPSAYYIVPREPVSPFYQWESNNGYCGEVSLIQAALNNGQWLSQFNARRVCGEFLGQTGGSGPSLQQAGTSPSKGANYNAQLLLQTPSQGLSGPDDFGNAARCAANTRMDMITYPSNTGYRVPNSGLAGYEDFMSWIKAQVIAGNQVTLGVLLNGNNDPQYDHIVTVIKIGTNHSPTDSTYYPDDVLYFDDHGLYTLTRSSTGTWSFALNPSIPLGAGSDSTGCTPYIFAYTFASLARTRAAANASGAPAFSIVIPKASGTTETVAGNAGKNGLGTSKVPGPHDFAFAVSGPSDPQGVTVPVVLTILGTKTLTNGVWQANPMDANSVPNAGYDYENPYIGGPVGQCDDGSCVSNDEPPAMTMTLQATVQDLTPGVTYNLYEYDFPSLKSSTAVGSDVALAVPTSDFNANSAMATSKISFIAKGTTYTAPEITRTSDKIVVFRAVPASAP
ncbi:MAG: hypothetical protein ACRDFS_00615 [Chloroflexota bacterium]